MLSARCSRPTPTLRWCQPYPLSLDAGFPKSVRKVSRRGASPRVAPAAPSTTRPHARPALSGEMCIRTDPAVHKTIGFFVAVFQRKGPAKTAALRRPPIAAEPDSQQAAAAEKRASTQPAKKKKVERAPAVAAAPAIGSASRKAKKRRKGKARPVLSVTAAAERQ